MTQKKKRQGTMPQRYNLRPVFYRTRQSSEVLSGWMNVYTGDVFTSVDGVHFELVPGARPALTLHERVRFARAVDLYPVDYIEPLEAGIVSYVDHNSGTTSVMLEGVHNGLEGNCLTLTPHIDDHVLDALEFNCPRKPSKLSLIDRVLCGVLAGLIVAAGAIILLET